MKRIKLDFGSEITISDEAFEQISAIVKANRVCDGCGQPWVYGREIAIAAILLFTWLSRSKMLERLNLPP